MQNPNPENVLSIIIENTKPYLAIESFSDKPGIYGITLLDSSKPLKCGGLVIEPKYSTLYRENGI